MKSLYILQEKSKRRMGKREVCMTDRDYVYLMSDSYVWLLPGGNGRLWIAWFRVLHYLVDLWEEIG
jgi:hypothetical protein